MRIENYSKSGTYIRIILIQLILVISTSLATGCYADKKSSPYTVDMVVVFKINVPMPKASSILFEKEYIFYEGSDSSKGKKYIRETGPKYIVKVPKDKMEAFNFEMKDIPQIYEIYKADWSTIKD